MRIKESETRNNKEKFCALLEVKLASNVVMGTVHINFAYTVILQYKKYMGPKIGKFAASSS